MAAQKKLPEIQVIIPYSDLVALLDASDKLDMLTESNRHLEEQLGALRSQFTELLTAFGDLKKFVTD